MPPVGWRHPERNYGSGTPASFKRVKNRLPPGAACEAWVRAVPGGVVDPESSGGELGSAGRPPACLGSVSAA
jgi:hypothetical protein